jgi:drug/metabolite transporter superfamily protein YnfA
MLPALKESNLFRKLAGYGGLFTSFGTLICCALPSMLVLLGFGAGLASFLGQYPQLIWLSENKEWVFGVSFSMLGLSYFAQKYGEQQSCPIEQREDCQSAKGWGRLLWFITLGINFIGAFYAFILPRLI